MRKKVTRTIEATKMNCLVFDPTSHEVIERSKLVMKTFKTELDKYSYLQQEFLKDGYNFISVKQEEPYSELRGMSLEDFIRYSQPVTKAEAEAKNVQSEAIEYLD